MKKLFEVILPLPPSVNRYQGKTILKQGRYQRIQFYPTKETIEWKQYATKTIMRILEDCDYVFPVLRNRYVIAEVEYTMSQRKEDPDNYFKVPFDLFQTLNIVENDDQIIPRVIDVTINKENPTMKITLYLHDKLGMFKDSDEYTRFRHRCCNICRRNKACSLREKALSNHYIESIDTKNLVCYSQNILSKHKLKK